MSREALTIQTFFRITNKEAKTVDYMLNDEQLQIDADLTGRDIIPKGRQMGVSMYFLGRYTAACLDEERPNVNAMIVSHESGASERLLRRCKFFVKNFKGPPIRLQEDSKESLYFPATNSRLFIGTAGSKKLGRGDTLTHLHCSEYAYWPDAKTTFGGLAKTVPRGTGEIAIESTGNGIGNDYFRRCMRSYNNDSVYKCHFLPWHTFHEYQTPLTSEQKETLRNTLREEWEEPLLYKNGLSLERIAWRREELDECDYDLNLFKQEYPMTIHECFQATGHSIFYKVNYMPTHEWIQVDTHTHMLKGHPVNGYRYCIGADPAGGVGGDNSSYQIICVETNQQVGEYANPFISPDMFGELLATVAKHYNNAFVVVESNNHGPVTLDHLRDNYEDTYIYQQPIGGSGTANIYDSDLMSLGLRTTVRSKPLLIGNLRRAVATTLMIHSSDLKGEMDTFIETDKKKLEAESGCFDDRVMAMAMANFGLSEAMTFAGTGVEEGVGGDYIDPFSLEGIRASGREKPNYGITSQHRRD